MNSSITIPSTPARDNRQEQIHHLWLLLIGIAARGDGKLFEPTRREQTDVDLLILRTGLTTAAVEHLTDQARRFAQVQAEIMATPDPLPQFNALGDDVKALIGEKRQAMLDYDRRIRIIEKKRQAFGALVTRLAAMRQESESLQKQVARYGNGVGNGD